MWLLVVVVVVVVVLPAPICFTHPVFNNSNVFINHESNKKEIPACITSFPNLLRGTSWSLGPGCRHSVRWLPKLWRHVESRTENPALKSGCGWGEYLSHQLQKLQTTHPPPSGWQHPAHKFQSSMHNEVRSCLTRQLPMRSRPSRAERLRGEDFRGRGIRGLHLCVTVSGSQGLGSHSGLQLHFSH